MMNGFRAGDLVIATPRLSWLSRAPGIQARHHNNTEWNIRIPQDSLLLVAAAAVTDYTVKVLHNDQLFYVLYEDVKLAEVTQ